VLYPSAGGVGTRELAALIRQLGTTTDVGSQPPQKQEQSPQPPPPPPPPPRLVTVIIVDSKWNNDG